MPVFGLQATDRCWVGFGGGSGGGGDFLAGGGGGTGLCLAAYFPRPERFELGFGGGGGGGGDLLAGGFLNDGGGDGFLGEGDGNGFFGEGGGEGRFYVGTEVCVGDWVHPGEDSCGGNWVLSCILPSFLGNTAGDGVIGLGLAMILVGMARASLIISEASSEST